MHSIKLKLENPPDMENYFREFGKLKRIAYSRLKEGKSPVECVKWIKANIEAFLDGCFIESASIRAQDILNSKKELEIDKVVFGSKKSFKDYNKGKISKQELLKRRNPNLVTIGRAADPQGNRKFKIDIKNKRFVFCPNKDTQIPLNFLARPKMLENLEKLEFLAKSRELPITYTLTRTHIILAIDETRVVEEFEKIKDRVLGIDLNPDFIGISISDFKGENQTEVFSQIFDLRKLNKLSIDKKKYEQLQISNRIIKLCKHYKVEMLAIEKLEIESKNHSKGKNFNRMINSWDRNTIINNLRKHCGFLGIKFQKVVAQYSSFVGCLMYPDKIDSIAASLELARRANLFQNVFINKILPKETKIVFPEWKESLMIRWKDDLGTRVLDNWKSAFTWFKKNPKLYYRVLFKDVNPEVFRMKSRRSNIFLYFT